MLRRRRTSQEGSSLRRLLGIAASAALGLVVAAPAYADDIGLAQLRAADPTLVGTGVPVAQVEAPLSSANPPDFEVNPTAVGQPGSLFTWYSSLGTAMTFPNSIGQESGHADSVGQIFYGSGSGVAPGISHVDNYEAGNFYNNLIGTLFPPAISAKVVNQSFIFGSATQPLTIAQQQTIDQAYDNYVARYGTIFVSGAGNSGTVTAPATAYNGIGVGAYGGSSATGPTLDGGRSKPDITAPASVTSFSTPLVSGAAALLVQAGTRGDGGAGTSAAAVDPRTVKALLLNGASKPADWAHTPTQPLDPRYGAGVLNIYNSWQQLKAGQQPVSGNTTPALGTPPTPISSGSSNAPAGWDFNSLTSSATNDSVNHYLVTLDPGTTYKLTGTLTWERQENQTAINNLDLLLYNVLTGTAVDQSISSVDNVEHLYTLNLTPGIYDLEVLKHGGATEVTDAETYALAYSFSAVPEPGAFSILALGAVGLLMRPWRGSSDFGFSRRGSL